MAVAKCGMLWTWDTPIWCSGKKTDENEVDKMCLGCPWREDNKNEDYDY